MEAKSTPRPGYHTPEPGAPTSLKVEHSSFNLQVQEKADPKTRVPNIGTRGTHFVEVEHSSFNLQVQEKANPKTRVPRTGTRGTQSVESRAIELQLANAGENQPQDPGTANRNLRHPAERVAGGRVISQG